MATAYAMLLMEPIIIIVKGTQRGATGNEIYLDE